MGLIHATVHEIRLNNVLIYKRGVNLTITNDLFGDDLCEVCQFNLIVNLSKSIKTKNLTKFNEAFAELKKPYVRKCLIIPSNDEPTAICKNCLLKITELM